MLPPAKSVAPEPSFACNASWRGDVGFGDVGFGDVGFGDVGFGAGIGAFLSLGFGDVGGGGGAFRRLGFGFGFGDTHPSPCSSLRSTPPPPPPPASPPSSSCCCCRCCCCSPCGVVYCYCCCCCCCCWCSLSRVGACTASSLVSANPCSCCALLANLPALSPRVLVERRLMAVLD